MRILRVFESLLNCLYFNLQITLYCGGHPLGSASVSLQSLLTTVQSLTSPAVIEALFPLVSPGQQRRNESTELPAVGVSVVLKHEDMRTAPSHQTTQPGNVEEPGSSLKLEREEEKPFHSETQEPLKNKHDKKTNEPRREELKDNEDLENKKSTTVRSPHNRGKEQEPEGATNALHHFCYSVDLRSILDLQVTSSVNCYLKYSYPFFGSASPVITSPPIEVRRHMEVLLPKSFCAFDFATNPIMLKETLSRVPLVVEVWHRDPLTKDVLLGVASVTLGHVFAAKKLKAARGKPSTYGQILSEKVHVVGDDGKPIGEIHVVLGLEDLGPATPELLEAHKNGSESFSSLDTAKASLPEKPKIDDPRKMTEYQTALELEMWKQQQEELFTTQVCTPNIE